MTDGTFHENRQGIYAIMDNQAREIVWGLHLFTSDAAAMRFYSDLATNPNNMVSKHTEDFDLHRLGYLGLTTGTISGTDNDGATIVLTGELWRAANRSNGDAGAQEAQYALPNMGQQP